MVLSYALMSSGSHIYHLCNIQKFFIWPT
jgi:hypothetical protein